VETARHHRSGRRRRRAALLAALLIWWVVRRVGRATGLDRKIDRFLDVDGDGLSPADRLKFQEQHPRGGSP